MLDSAARRALAALAFALLLASGFACGNGSRFPGGDWAKRDPGDLGLSRDRLDALARELGGAGVVVVDGVRVKRWGSWDERVDWYSAAKPVFSSLLFFAIQEGKVESVDTPIAELGWKLRGPDRGITFRQLANMTSGYARAEGPGEAFAYNDVAIALYQKTLFDRVFRGDPQELTEERLAPFGLEDGLVFGPKRRRMKASVRDFARIAWWWLNRGEWDGKVVLERRFFDESMRPQVPADLPRSARGAKDTLRVGSFGGGSDHFTDYGPGIYGFNWWFNATGGQHPDAPTWPGAPGDTVMALGAKGNVALLFPELGAVVVAAGAKWGQLEPGNARSRMARLVVQAAEAVRRQSPDIAASSHDEAPDVEVSGETKQWHRVTLAFRGPETSESARRNPFRDQRLDVTFTQGERRVVVPGHFAADGRAAHTGASEGDRWRVYFRPETPGTWQWQASFRRGKDVAISDDPRAGRGRSFDGTRGVVEIAPSDVRGRDFRAHGVLRYDGSHYLRWSGSGERFLKGGANSPENFLAYHEFDATPPSHRYVPHERDFRPGDPGFAGGRGRGIVGAINYLADAGMNAIYFLTLNVRGDGDDVWPWTGRGERDRYDVSKLDQWEIVFEHMERRGVLLHVVLQEQENDQLLDGGDLGPERRLYHRELVSRFGHHLGLVWNLGEENTNSHEERVAFAEHLREIDPLGHPVVVHTRPRGGMEPVYAPLLGHEAIAGAALQTRDTHRRVVEWRRRSAEAGHPWVVSLDELNPSGAGVVPDAVDPEHDRVRANHLWPSLLAGGAGVEWYFGYKHAHHDLTLEDWRSRARMWEQTRIALDFFREHLPFWEMSPCDGALSGTRGHCFGQPGLWAVQARGGDPALDVGSSGSVRIDWLDPRTDGALEPGSVAGASGPGVVSIGRPPRDPAKDWIALVRETPAG